MTSALKSLSTLGKATPPRTMLFSSSFSTCGHNQLRQQWLKRCFSGSTEHANSNKIHCKEENKNNNDDDNEEGLRKQVSTNETQRQYKGEIGGPQGAEPTRYGDWERKGRVSDF
eukprot:m.8893 g.8893  ORF g.8893 m.8893 type:complete len:114 (+) comp3292_c1_seq1:51-392(+)